MIYTTNQYPDVEFPDNVTSMFADFILEHDARFEVFFFIVGKRQKKEPTTIPEIMENVTVQRRVKKQKGKNTYFDTINGPIDRKLAEKIVDQLYCMSLVYFEHQNPYRRIYLTRRGLQVLLHITQKLQKKKEDDD